MEIGDDGGGLAHDGKRSCQNYILKLLAFKFVLYHALSTRSSSLQNNLKNTTGLAAIQQAARVYGTVMCAVCNWVNETSETTKTGSSCGYVGVGIFRNRTHNYKISIWMLFGRCLRVTSLSISNALHANIFRGIILETHPTANSHRRVSVLSQLPPASCDTTGCCSPGPHWAQQGSSNGSSAGLHHTGTLRCGCTAHRAAPPLRLHSSLYFSIPMVF